MFLEGHIYILSKLKDKDITDYELNLLYLNHIKIIYEKSTEGVETISDSFNSNIIIALSKNLKSSEKDLKSTDLILKHILKIVINDDTNIIPRLDVLEQILFAFLDNTKKMKEKSIDFNKSKSGDLNTNILTSLIIHPLTFEIQKNLTKILRIAFSIEKNRKFFVKIFPSSLLTSFIDLENFEDEKIYESFCDELNMLKYTQIRDIRDKSLNLLSSNDAERKKQVIIGGYQVIELLVNIIS